MTSRVRLAQLVSLGALLCVLGAQVWQGLSTRVHALPAIQLVVVAMALGLTLAGHRRRGMMNEGAGWIVLLNVALIYALHRAPNGLDFAAAVAAISLLAVTLYRPARARTVNSGG